MPRESKHQLISETLIKEIAAGQFKPSGRLPSEAQLVKRFGVSRPTVGRALRELQDKGLIERRAGSGSYVRHNRSTTDSTRQLGLLVPELRSTEIFEVICGALARLARVHDYGLLWEGRDARESPEQDGIDDAEALCQHYIDHKVSGVFFAPLEKHDNRDELNHRLAVRLQKAGISVVLLDRDLADFPQRSEFDLVGIDNFAAGFTVAEHLLKLDCKRLGFLLTRQSAPTAKLRIAGVREAILARGIDIGKDFVQRCEPDDPSFLKKLTDKRKREFDAIICGNDRTAATLLQSLTKAGVDVPKDIRMVGFDDVNYASLLSVPLTTMRQPCRDIAAVAFRAMIDSLEERDIPPRAYLLPATLVVRESCGAYAKS